MNIHDEMRMTELDSRDSEILAERQAQFDSRDGPRVGDYIHMLDGTLRRFTHNWGDGLQTTYRWRDAKNREMFDPKQDACGGSFHLGNGYVSFSGSLDDAIPLSRIVDTGETRNGPVWFFHHDWMKAHNGVQASLVCRVYRETSAREEWGDPTLTEDQAAEIYTGRKCVANHYATNREQIIEIGGPNESGCLISVLDMGGSLRIHIYRGENCKVSVDPALLDQPR